MKGGTFQVRVEGCAGVGQAEREQFVQREGSHGTLGESRAVLSGWRMESREEGAVWMGNMQKQTGVCHAGPQRPLVFVLRAEGRH